MKRKSAITLLCFSAFFLNMVGCSDTKDATPRLADPTKEDPRLKPASSGGPPGKPLSVDQPNQLPIPARKFATN